MEIKAVSIKDIDFSPYGVYYNMREEGEGVAFFKTEVFEDHMTKIPLIDTLAHLGYTIGAAAPYTPMFMEKHDHTQEAMFCAAESIVLCFAVARGDLPPQAEDVQAVLIHEGDVIVINRNVWHDACHGLGKSTGYYYLATAGKSPAVWQPISGEVILVSY